MESEPKWETEDEKSKKRELGVPKALVLDPWLLLCAGTQTARGSLPFLPWQTVAQWGKPSTDPVL